MVTAAKSPAHLRPATRAWFRSVCSTYVLDPHHIRLLELAGEAWDRCEEAREAIAKDGAYSKDRFGAIRRHPGVGTERDSMIVFSRLLRELDLDIEPPRNASRPPARY